MEKKVQGERPRPKVGIGVMIQNSKGEVLLGLRNSSHGAGEWNFPGGHLEFGEKLFETAKREVKEETDLDVDEFELVSVADEMRYIKTDGKHYLNIGIAAKYKGGEPKLMESNKCEQWKWFDLSDLPERLFEGTAFVLRNFKDKKIYQPEKGAPKD